MNQRTRYLISSQVEFIISMKLSHFARSGSNDTKLFDCEKPAKFLSL